MVLHLATIPLYIQTQIASQIDFTDFKKFRECSKLGRDLGALVKPTMLVDSLYVSMRDFLPTYEINLSQKASWRVAKTQENCPRFRIDTFRTNEQITMDRCKELIKLGEEGHFVGRQSFLYISHLRDSSNKNPINGDSMTMDIEVFLRFIEVFNITEIDSLYPDLVFRRHPIIHQMDYVRLGSSIDDEDFLSLKAHTMHLELPSPSATSTLNTFLKQWIHNNRKTTVFSLQNFGVNEWSQSVFEEIFADLDFVVLWSPETHDSSILSHLPLDIIYNPNRFVCTNMYCSLSNGTKTLLIKFYEKKRLYAKEVDDANEEVLKKYEQKLKERNYVVKPAPVKNYTCCTVS